MTANVSNIYICPKCESASSSKSRPEYCPNCKYKFRKPNETLAKEFSWGKLPNEQFFEIVQQETERLLDAPLKEMLGEKSKDIPEEVTVHRKTKVHHIKNIWEKKLEKFFMNTSKEQIEDLMRLVYEIMRSAIPAGDKPRAQSMAIMGSRIGEMAEAIDHYIKTGGKLVKIEKK
jgi:hypothetical protein